MRQTLTLLRATMFSERTGDLMMAASATIGAVIVIAALFLLLLAA